MFLSQFTDPKLLAAIGPDLLSKFLAFFQNDPVHHPDCALPTPLPGSHLDFEDLAERFRDRKLPTSLCAAAAQIEEASSSPEKLAQLEQLIQALPPNLSLPAGLHPVHRSLQLWLWMADGLIPPRRALFPVCVTRFAPNPAPNLKQSPPASADPKPAPAPSEGPDSDGPISARQLSLIEIAGLRRNKILHFPSQIVETIHSLLQKKCTFDEIAAAIGPYGVLLNRSNLSRFRKSRAHRDWLREQRTRDRLQFQVRSVLGVSTDSDPAKLQRALHDATAVRICQAITACNPATLSQLLQQDPTTLLSLLKVLPQLTQGAMEIERKSVKIDAARKRNRRAANAKRGVSPETFRLIEEKLNLM